MEQDNTHYDNSTIEIAGQLSTDGKTLRTLIRQGERVISDSVRHLEEEALRSALIANGWMPPEQSREMREAIKTAFSAFNDLWEVSRLAPKWALENADAALTKLEPLLKP